MQRAASTNRTRVSPNQPAARRDPHSPLSEPGRNPGPSVIEEAGSLHWSTVTTYNGVLFEGAGLGTLYRDVPLFDGWEYILRREN